MRSVEIGAFCLSRSREAGEGVSVQAEPLLPLRGPVKLLGVLRVDVLDAPPPAACSLKENRSEESCRWRTVSTFISSRTRPSSFSVAELSQVRGLQVQVVADPGRRGGPRTRAWTCSLARARPARRTSAPGDQVPDLVEQIAVVVPAHDREWSPTTSSQCPAAARSIGRSVSKVWKSGRCRPSA